jgi:DNA-binding NarL/FixJ family response regulator
MMSGQKMQALLVSLPGLVREATCATLASLGGVSLVGSASGALTATHLLQHLQVDLLLVDANLPDEEVQALLRWAKEHYPQMQCLVMTMTSRQRTQALAWGADAAIQRFDLSSQLPAVLSQLPVEVLPEQHLGLHDSL